jgi:site-specific DNA-methyltransferase (adenine-specific)
MSFLADIHHGCGAEMNHIANGEAALVLTSPPYYPATIEMVLRMPVKEQNKIPSVCRAVEEFQESLWPVLNECFRILRQGGTLCMVSADIRYGGFLFGVTDILRRGALKAGFRLFNRIHLRMIGYKRRLTKNSTSPFRVDDTSAIEVFSKGYDPAPAPRRDISDEEYKRLTNPLWVVNSAGNSRIHPHQLSNTVIRRLLNLYSQEQELVVDPFAGSGSTVIEAARSRRRAVGYEIDRERSLLASDYLQTKLRRFRP